MKYNNKKLGRFSKFINYTIAIGLCGFLIAFSSLLMRDVDNFSAIPRVDEFKDHSFLNQQNKLIADIEMKRDSVELIKNAISNKLKIAVSDYKSAKTSFDNWLSARSTIGNTKENRVVRNRAKELDVLLLAQSAIELEGSEIEEVLTDLDNQKEALQNEINRSNTIAFDKYLDAEQWHNVKTFLIRMAIVLPILLLAVFFFIRYRKHRYAALFTGFNLFAVYVFFFGLVPYLPSYGGYIRYTVGIILIIGLGILSINKIRQFIERKREELKLAQSDRANNVQLDIAEKALEAHMCPSCGKDFVVRSFKKLPGKGDKLHGVLFTTNYCRYCGLILFKDCHNCQTENFVHLPYCSKCGVETKKEMTVA